MKRLILILLFVSLMWLSQGHSTFPQAPPPMDDGSNIIHPDIHITTFAVHRFFDDAPWLFTGMFELHCYATVYRYYSVGDGPDVLIRRERLAPGITIDNFVVPYADRYTYRVEAYTDATKGRMIGMDEWIWDWEFGARSTMPD